MSPLDASILGVVEGLTEFLPVSSTGHMILASSLLGIAGNDATKSFEIVVQLGAILAVVALYWRSFLDIELLKRLIVAFVPTGVIGLALYKIVKMFLLGNDAVVLVSLALGGLALIMFEYWHTEKPDADGTLSDISYRQAFLIGLFQSIAIIPGVSRSAATIVGGLLLGLKRTTIVEFSFLLAVPTMAAATGLDLLKSGGDVAAIGVLPLALGFAIAFGIALGSIRWLLSYVRSHSFVPFGAYRIGIAALLAFVLLR